MRGRVRVGAVGRVGRGAGVTSGFGNADCGLRNEECRFWMVGLGVLMIDLKFVVLYGEEASGDSGEA